MKIAILGAGVVGGGVFEVLNKNRGVIAKRAGCEIEVSHILCRRPRPEHPAADLLRYSFEDIINDPEVSVIAECMGGITPAYDYVKRSLLAGKSVVTSNKELVAEHGRELCDIAEKMNLSFMFEAAVAGGIPVLRPICRCLAANEISSVVGILNGTTNYILTEMIRHGKSFNDALAEAQAKGFAEADPTADVMGIDAGRKICILADLCFGKEVKPKDVRTEGIDKISKVDIELARELGYRIKLLGQAMRTGPNSVTAFVAPTLISRSNPLSSVDGVQNAVRIKGDAVGEVLLTGPGAGALPTASAVTADIIDAVRGGTYMGYWPSEPGYVTDPEELSCRFMIRAEAELSSLQAILPDATVVHSRSGDFALLTAYTSEKELLSRLSEISLISIYRVLD